MALDGMHNRLTLEQQAELMLLKRTRPYRIVFGALEPLTGEWQTFAEYTRRKLNNLARAGWLIWEAKSA